MPIDECEGCSSNEGACAREATMDVAGRSYCETCWAEIKGSLAVDPATPICPGEQETK